MRSDSSKSVLDDIRVVNLGEGAAAGLVGLILADFGAEVIKVERPGGDPWRAHPASKLTLRGQRSVVWDRDDAALTARLRGFVLESADVFVTTRSDLSPFGLDAATLMQERPDLVCCELSAFGAVGPYAGLPLYEGLVAARAGRMMTFRGLVERDGPVYSAVPVATHAASQAAAAGILAALTRRERTGRGARLETSLLRGLLPYEMGGLLAAQMAERTGAVSDPPDPMTLMPSIIYHPVQCADGRWLQLGNLLPHLFARFLTLTGLDRDVPEALRGSLPQSWPPEAVEAFRDRMLTRMQARTAAEWMALFVADGGVVAHTYQTTQQALDDPDIVANGHVVAHGGVRRLGPVARLSATPAVVGDDVPVPGSARLDDLPPRKLRRRPVDSNDAAPLAGITVVEFAAIIAAPLGAAMLADLGARVIKVEPLEGDAFRGMGGGFGAARVNTGKESLTLDLKQPEGRRVAAALVARADLLIHNYRPGVPERLGIGYEDVRATNPRLVYVSVNGYGPDGPGALRPSTHPIPGAALGGVLYELGGEPARELGGRMTLRDTARRLFRANEVNPDPNTSMVVATAAMLGLLARTRHGVGQEIFVDMFGANAWANFDDFLDYPGKPARRLPDRQLHGLGPLNRLYRCRTGWVFLAAEQPDEAERLGSALRALGHGVDAWGGLEVVFAREDAGWWESHLVSEGIGCVRADLAAPAQFLHRDPVAREAGLVGPARHRDWGTYQRHGRLVEYDAASRANTAARCSRRSVATRRKSTA